MMRSRSRHALQLAIAALTLSAIAVPFADIAAQAKKPKKEPRTQEQITAAMEKAVARAKVAEAFYSSTEPLDVTLTTNIKKIRGDKGDKAPWRPATLTYTDATGKSVVVPTHIKTRGIWRLKNCEFPPLRLDFKQENTEGTVFRGIDKPKLVSYCRNDDEYEQYILQEAQLYRVYRLLTPASHRSRLLRMTYVDSATGKSQTTRAAILLEEPEVLAARMGGPLLKLQGATGENLEPYHDALVGVFQYLIGNTDFSVFALHNIELIGLPDGNALPVPFDFDFSGMVDARYATVDPKLSVSRVRDRLMRGYCVPSEEYTKVFTLFNEKKDAIYALYNDALGKLMRPKLAEATLKYYDDFYKTINDPRRAKSEIISSCIRTGG